MMTCNEARMLMHALIDGELDAGHARQVEAHVADCAGCEAELRNFREMRRTMAARNLGFAAPAALRARIEAELSDPPAVKPPWPVGTPSRRSLLKGFGLGAVLSAAAAATVMLAVIHTDYEQRILGDIVSAHLRSLQADHLTDVLSTDQHTVKPWFNGRLDVAPPVVDLTAQGFTLLGGRLDYIEGKAVAAIVYRRRGHVINLFVFQNAAPERFKARSDSIQGFNIERWNSSDLSFIAISDINVDELQEFVSRFEAASRS